MTDIDHARLRELAEKATPGPWIADEEAPAYTASQRVYAPFLGTEQDDTICEAVDFPDAEFIAAFNPETAKALLDELKRAKSDLAAAEAEVLDLQNDVERVPEDRDA